MQIVTACYRKYWVKFAGLCCAGSQTTRLNNPSRLSNLRLFQFATSRHGCLIHRTSCIIFQLPLLQLCSSSVPPPHHPASCALFQGSARPPARLPEPRRALCLPRSSSQALGVPGAPSPCLPPPPVPEMRSHISGLRAERPALLMDTGSRACSALLTQVQGFLELLHAHSVRLSSSSSRPLRNCVKGN